MGIKMLSIFCGCLNKMYCMCKGLISPPEISQISEKKLQEWKRIEGIDQFPRERP